MMDEIDPYESERTPQLRDYVSVLRRRLLLILSGMVLGAAAGGLLWAVQSERYTSVATILLEPIVRDAFQVRTPVDRSVDADTERRVLLSRSVAESAGGRMNPPRSPDAMLQSVTVTQPGDLLLRVSFSAAGQQAAQNGAQAYVDAYLERRGSEGAAQLEQSRQPVSDRLAQAEAELAQVLATLAAQRAVATDPALQADDLTVIEAQTRQDVLVTLIEQLQAELVALDAIDTSGGQVLDPAILPAEPSNPTLLRLTLLGGVGGLLLGVVLAFVRDRLDDRMVDPDQDLSPLALPIVGRLPRLNSGSVAGTPAGDALRQLRDRLVAVQPVADGAAGNGARRATVTMFTAVHDDPSTNAVAQSFASTLSPDVLLVRADLRTTAAGGPRQGLAEVLVGAAKLADVVHTEGAEAPVAVVDPGQPVRDPGELLQQEGLEAFFATARSGYRHVVVAAPPALRYADDLVLARFADRVVVCVEGRVTQMPALRRAIAELREAGKASLSAVVVRS